MAEAAAGGAQSKAPLDEVMLAMDVVDTLRHREHLVARELSEGARKQTLIERLRSIYAAQGIDVPDRILEEGVEGLRKERFVYTPPPPGPSVALARAYVTRWQWGRYVAAGILAVAVAYGAYQGLVVWPAERAAEAQRVELAQTLPAELSALRDAVRTVSEVAAVTDEAQSLYETGIAAARAGDIEAARAARAALTELRARLEREYEVRIVNRPNEQSGLWRIPDVNQAAKNFYLVVEAAGPSGERLQLPIRNEETGRTEIVGTWAVRVSEAQFERVRLDKRDDGIIQDELVATKSRGFLEPDYALPVLGGAITEW